MRNESGNFYSLPVFLGFGYFSWYAFLMNGMIKNNLSEAVLRKMSAEETEQRMEAMRDTFDLQDEPKVGIFWYDEANDDLFGVSKVNAEDLHFNSNGIKTISTLHKAWWQKQKNKAVSKGRDPGIFSKNYTLIPRGRIFQIQADNSFRLNCGSWINDHIVDLVIQEFDLPGQVLRVEIDIHWELGHGWSEDYVL